MAAGTIMGSFVLLRKGELVLPGRALRGDPGPANAFGCSPFRRIERRRVLRSAPPLCADGHDPSLVMRVRARTEDAEANERRSGFLPAGTGKVKKTPI